jgi:hypothetical protein
MLALPPLEIMLVTAELERRALRSCDRQSIGKMSATDMAGPSSDLLRFDWTMPGNAPITALVETGSINRAHRIATVSMPVLAICPMVIKYLETADFAEGHDCLIGCGISPDTAIAAVETASAAIVRSAVRQANLLKGAAAL